MCQAVRYETRGDPFAINYCHCRSCRRHNGAPVVTLAGFKESQIRFSGDSRKTFESSPGVNRAFCSKCGTPLTWEGEGGDLGPIIELHVSTFDEPDLLAPSSHAFYPERVAWFEVEDNLPRYEGFSEDSALLHHGPLRKDKALQGE